MRVKFVHRPVFGILLICQFSVCLGTELPDANDNSKYLGVVRTFADNVVARSTRGLRLPAKGLYRR